VKLLCTEKIGLLRGDKASIKDVIVGIKLASLLISQTSHIPLADIEQAKDVHGRGTWSVGVIICLKGGLMECLD
jgi:hypothetical protein